METKINIVQLRFITMHCCQLKFPTNVAVYMDVCANCNTIISESLKQEIQIMEKRLRTKQLKARLSSQINISNTITKEKLIIAWNSDASIKLKQQKKSKSISTDDEIQSKLMTKKYINKCLYK